MSKLSAFKRSIFITIITAGAIYSAAGEPPVTSADLTRHLLDSLPPTWSYQPMQQDIPTVADGWWRTFGDNTLDSLIALGLDYNYNLAMTMRRTAIARAAMQQARAAWYPTLALSAGWSRNRESGAMTTPPMPPTVTSGFNAGLTAQWEIDIFGEIASGVKAKKAAYNASRAEYAGAMVSLCAQIATTYLNMRAMQAQLEIAQAHLASQLTTVKIARARYEADLVSKLDVAQAEENYYTTMASLPKMQYSIHSAINSLEVLTGKFSPALRQQLEKPAPLPECRRMIGADVPADLLRRRPDIAQAELELAQYAAAIGIAKKDFLPTLSINGSVGTRAHDIDNLFSHDSFTYSIAPTLSWTIFEGFERKYALASAREQMQAGIDNYNLVVAQAYEEADNAVAGYHFSMIYLDALDNVLQANSEAVKLSMESYKNSLSPMIDVVNAQINALAAEQEKVAAQGSALESLVNLYEALGGGFDLNTLDVNL